MRRKVRRLDYQNTVLEAADRAPVNAARSGGAVGSVQVDEPLGVVELATDAHETVLDFD